MGQPEGAGSQRANRVVSAGDINVRVLSRFFAERNRSACQHVVELASWRSVDHVTNLRVVGAFELSGFANHMNGVGDHTAGKADRRRGEKDLEQGHHGLLIFAI